MKLSQKRTCNNCRASTATTTCWPMTWGCELYYRVGDRHTPLEPCPKPTTIEEYLFALNNYKKIKKNVDRE